MSFSIYCRIGIHRITKVICPTTLITIRKTYNEETCSTYLFYLRVKCVLFPHLLNYYFNLFGGVFDVTIIFPVFLIFLVKICDIAARYRFGDRTFQFLKHINFFIKEPYNFYSFIDRIFIMENIA